MTPEQHHIVDSNIKDPVLASHFERYHILKEAIRVMEEEASELVPQLKEALRQGLTLKDNHYQARLGENDEIILEQFPPSRTP